MSADGDIEVLSLMRTPSGHLTNLSLSGSGSGNVAETLTQNSFRHTLALFRPAGQTQQGFARVINRSDRAGTVSIWGADDEGDRRGPITHSLDAHATRHFNSEDLERGNAEKGLSGGLGTGVGDWRLEL